MGRAWRRCVSLGAIGLASLLLAAGCVQRLPDRQHVTSAASVQASVSPKGVPPAPKASVIPTLPPLTASRSPGPTVGIASCAADNLKFAQRQVNGAGVSWAAQIEFVSANGVHCRLSGRIEVTVVNRNGTAEPLAMEYLGTAPIIVLAGTTPQPGEARAAYITVSWTSAEPKVTCASPVDVTRWRLTLPDGTSGEVPSNIAGEANPCGAQMKVTAAVAD